MPNPDRELLFIPINWAKIFVAKHGTVLNLNIINDAFNVLYFSYLYF
jgi:hypothetical protein